MTIKQILKKIQRFILCPYLNWRRKKKQKLNKKIFEIYKGLNLDDDFHNGSDTMLMALDIMMGGNDADDYALYLSSVDINGLNRIAARKKFREVPERELNIKSFYISKPYGKRYLCRNAKDAY